MIFSTTSATFKYIFQVKIIWKDSAVESEELPGAELAEPVAEVPGEARSMVVLLAAAAVTQGSFV